MRGIGRQPKGMSAEKAAPTARIATPEEAGQHASSPYTLSLVRSGCRSEIKAIPKNHLGDQVVGRTGETHAEAEIDLPLRRYIQIDRRENLMLLT